MAETVAHAIVQVMPLSEGLIGLLMVARRLNSTLPVTLQPWLEAWSAR
jgi:hypothetical protein